MIDLIKSQLPEAMPKRYGFFEPPQFALADTGEAHFRRFIKENKDEGPLVFYPHRPVMGLFVGIDDPPQCRVRSAKSHCVPYDPNTFTVDVEKCALEQPGWKKQLRVFWERVTSLLRPFYGEVRTTDGYIRGHGSRHWIDGKTQQSPVGGLWYGLPRELGHAAVLGSPYLELWPEFCGSATIKKGLAFMSVDDWSGAESLGSVPNRLVQLPVGSETMASSFQLPRRSEVPPAAYPFDKPPFWRS